MSQQKFKSIQQAFARRVDHSSPRKDQSSKSLTKQFDRRGKSVQEHKQDINQLVTQALGQASQNQGYTLVEGAKEKLQILTMQMRKMHQAEERQTFGHTEAVKKESTKHFDALVKQHRSQMDEKKIRDGIKRKRWMIAQQILNVLLALKSMKISPRMALQKKVFPKSPFQHKNAYKFIKAVKRGAIEEVKNYLKEQSYLVHDFDYVHQTGAHWAAKRNNTGVLRVLLENGANPNAQDMGGRTPLFLASKLGCLACVKLLLAYKAKPNIKAHSGENSLDVAFNYKVKSFLMKARSLQIFLQFAPKEDRLKAWQSEGLKFFEQQSLEEMSEFVR